MARLNAFSVTIDVTPLDELATKLGTLTPEQVGALMVDAVNATTDATYDLARKTILGGINLTDEYVQRKMGVEHATAQNPTATIVAYGGKSYLTSLSHYGAMQLAGAVNWSNARIQADGHKFGKWPRWTRRTGNDKLGIAADTKGTGRSVEVISGSRKKLGRAFAIAGKTDTDGNPLVFQRIPGSKKSVRVLSGPSVYQLFRVAAGQIEDQVYGDLSQSVIALAERQFEKELS